MTEVTAKRRLPLLFVATICTGSFLLFLVQPLIARMALPRLGGAPAVWNSAMLVYQALLLGGYAYAHALTRLQPRAQAGVHLALLLIAALMLPIGLVAATPSATADPLFWVPWLLVASIGPLFFAVAAQAPLMQRWFALSGGGDPYALYAASNLGSFAGLIAYPLIVEPLLPLAGQSAVWSIGYALLILLVAMCALRLPKRGEVAAVEATGPAPSLKTVLHWIALAAVPSGLMLSTTTHLTTDVVAMPLLWVIPLGLYLLSFSIAFATRRGLAEGISNLTPLILLIAGGTAFANSSRYPLLFLPIGLILLFTVSVALHTALYNRRPEPARLTGFYLAMSAGGVLGGSFCALLAPVVFDWAYEHPILILAAAALVVQTPLFGIGDRLGPAGRAAIALAVIAVAALPGLDIYRGDTPNWVTLIVTLVLLAAALIAIGHRWLFVLVLAGQMYALGAWSAIRATLTEGVRERSYFGIYTVNTRTGRDRQLVHGTTVHGIQSLQPGRERIPLSYYAPRSGVGIALMAAPANARVGIVGLGSGTLACYAKPGQDWRFYEIDPLVVDIARDETKFTFLSRCLPGVPVEIGDARIVLASEPPAGLDILVIDAFSSDAVPMHLLTREALQTYGRRLDSGGLLMMHISNRFLQLEPVLAAAQADGWQIAVRDYDASGRDAKLGFTSSLWVALSRDPAVIAPLRADTTNWRAIRPRAGFAGWTDDHASILPLLKWGAM